MRDKQKPTLKAYWVMAGRLIAGEYPGSIDETHARRRLHWLTLKGVNTYLDLTEPGEAGLEPYMHLLEDESSREGVEINHARIAIPDMSVTTEGQMARILDKLDNHIGAGDTVYLHCYGGKGRTGMVVGCYLVRHGMTGEAALEEIVRLREGIPGTKGPSPETMEQNDMVRNWRTGH